MPRITVAPNDTQAEYQDEVILSCTAEGMPPPTFAWYREVPGQPPVELNATLSTTDEGVVVYERISTLTLADVQPSDTANYTCEATNDLGSDNDTAQLIVLGRSSLPRSLLPSHPPSNTHYQLSPLLPQLLLRSCSQLCQ